MATNVNVESGHVRTSRHPRAHRIHDILTGPVARVLFGLPFIAFGMSHFFMIESMSAVVPDWAPFSAGFWVVATGVVLLACGVGVVYGGRPARVAGPVLAGLLLTFVVTIHIPTLIAGGDGANMATVNLMKDLALAGAALLVSFETAHAHV
ncbi:MAG: DoxX family protein [Deltaproteobacteria bacterium]|nr:DoxX family protein [Deltaproteobacteria bacterium]